MGEAFNSVNQGLDGALSTPNARASTLAHAMFINIQSFQPSEERGKQIALQTITKRRSGSMVQTDRSQRDTASRIMETGSPLTDSNPLRTLSVFKDACLHNKP